MLVLDAKSRANPPFAHTVSGNRSLTISVESDTFDFDDGQVRPAIKEFEPYLDLLLRHVPRYTFAERHKALSVSPKAESVGTLEEQSPG